MPRGLFRKAVQQGRSEQRGDAYFLPYVEPLSDARTPLADFVNSLLAGLAERSRLEHKGKLVCRHRPPEEMPLGIVAPFLY
jgi:hypothetical protein